MDTTQQSTRWAVVVGAMLGFLAAFILSAQLVRVFNYLEAEHCNSKPHPISRTA